MCGPRLHPLYSKHHLPWGEQGYSQADIACVRPKPAPTVVAEYKQNAQLKHLIIGQTRTRRGALLVAPKPAACQAAGFSQISHDRSQTGVNLQADTCTGGLGGQRGALQEGRRLRSLVASKLLGLWERSPEEHPGSFLEDYRGRCPLAEESRDFTFWGPSYLI